MRVLTLAQREELGLISLALETQAMTDAERVDLLTYALEVYSR